MCHIPSPQTDHHIPHTCGVTTQNIHSPDVLPPAVPSVLPIVETVSNDDILSDSDSFPSDDDSHSSAISLFDDYDDDFGINAVRMNSFDTLPSSDIDLDLLHPTSDPMDDSCIATCTCCKAPDPTAIDQFLDLAASNPS